MVSALLALVATLGAFVATGLLVSRAYKDRLLYLIAWSLTLVGISLALLAMVIGFLTGFNGPTFRVIQWGAALIAPVWLALGMIELIARFVQVRFAAWLFAVSYTVVATVILTLDPLTGSFSKSLPKPSKVYDALPRLLIDGAHVVAVIALVGCAAVTAWLASKQDREAYELLIPVALVALAGVLVVSGTRGLLPGPSAVIALGLAAGLISYGAMRTVPMYQEEEAYGDDEYADEYDDRHAYAAAPPPPPQQPQPQPKRGELRFPEPSAPPPVAAVPSPLTTVDDVRVPLAEAQQACGQITVYTLLDGREAAFDRLAEDLVAAARSVEGDTLIFACHEVVNAPTQRIFYQLFRSEMAFAAHRGQPHLQRFMAESRTHVLATNVIELRLGAAKLPM
ncbi:putative quinol monooxygenase [Spirillospora sp. CA-294931]|uniref:putative quinol monooxygenase n=1 Tax=Spirillospora sp. CA-294931 TaxID=3240042 RepID=UPI003D9275F4